jgi:hypothetical protein
MNDAELLALATLVNAGEDAMNRQDQMKLAQGFTDCYGECEADGKRELRAELVRRGVLKE